jgi:hypothetical protein
MSPSVVRLRLGQVISFDFDARDDRVVVVACSYQFFCQRAREMVLLVSFLHDLPEHSADCRVVIAEEAYCLLAIRASV